MCGICGNADYNPYNDWTKPDGTNVYEQDNELGESWRVLWNDGWYVSHWKSYCHR